MSEIENHQNLVKSVARAMKKKGWEIAFPTTNIEEYDFTAVKGRISAAVLVKNWKRTVGVPQIRKFTEFFKLPMGGQFNLGFFVTTSDFGKAAITLAEQAKTIHLATFQKKRLKILSQDNGTDVQVATNKDGKTYIGVFTCKGGVGKTTVSAHLSGALAMMGYDVALLDLDPQRHLNTLLPEGIYLPRKAPNLGSTINVFNYDEYDPSFKERFVICDCSPDFQNNPPEMMEKLNYCIIPTMLNPLGLNKNGHVIVSTLEKIRSINKNAYLMVLVNSLYNEKTTELIRVLRSEYQKLFKKLETKDKLFKFIDPEECAIRFSKQLFYWGSHIYMGGESELAFKTIGGRCLPKEDFLRLVEYLEESTQIGQFKLL